MITKKAESLDSILNTFTSTKDRLNKYISSRNVEVDLREQEIASLESKNAEASESISKARNVLGKITELLGE